MGVGFEIPVLCRGNLADTGVKFSRANYSHLTRREHPVRIRLLRCDKKAVSPIQIHCRSSDDYDVRLDGPIEPSRPKFVREAFETPPPGPFVPPFPLQEEFKKKRKGRRLVRATPAQAAVGALISAGCSAALFNWTMQCFTYLQAHPPVRNIPFGLTEDVNSLFLTMVVFFGGLAVTMFGVTSVGLGLLAKKNLENPSPPS